MVLSVVGLAAVYLYLSLHPTGPHPTSIPKNTVVPVTPVDAVGARGGSKLRIDLLATLQAVEVAGHRRDLFQFAAPEIKEVAKQARPEPHIVPNAATQSFGPPDVIPFRFYGYTSTLKQWRKRAFFLDGDAIYIAAEGELINSRYKVISVGVNSAVVEDTANLNQQSLPLVESI